MQEGDSADVLFLSPNAKDYMDNLRKEGLIVKRDTNIKHLNNSPLYYTIRFILIIYLVTFILATIYNTSDLLFCYLQAPVHSIRIRNTSLPTENKGFLFNASNYHSGETIAHYLQGYLKDVNIVVLEPYGLNDKYEPNSTEEKENYLINTNPNAIPRLIQGVFPMAIVMNGTNSADPTYNISMDSLWFATFPQASVRPTDGGTAASVDILNPNRKRIWVNSMWYSFSYWSSVETIYSDTRFTDDQKKTHGIPNLSDVPKTNYYCTTQMSSILPSQYNKSNVPIWFMNLTEASTARLKGIICSSNYGLVLNLSTWFCISPLLIYDLRLKSVVLSNVTFSGNLVLDFRTDEKDSSTTLETLSYLPHEKRTLPYNLLLNSSSLKIMTLTKDIKEFVIDSFGQSNFTFTIPKRVLTCTPGNISLGAPINANEEPCRLEFSGISGESYFTGDFHRYYSARYITPLDKFTELKIVVNLHTLDDLTLSFPFCTSTITPKFPLNVLDSRNNAIFSLDYVKDAEITFETASSSTVDKHFVATVTCNEAERTFTLALRAQPASQ
ncbi:Hypothetical protein GLP15_2551 [Giardia lamblia P15]|uniref:Uncharacterized protein n=1 Tax=Giardia intestinalis (strain P15) TaxID=658858 RepID=E1EXM0_GIAIA|nr:Hypothetical protein GLP15_2551 [Giardia lamblia P15]